VRLLNLSKLLQDSQLSTCVVWSASSARGPIVDAMISSPAPALGNEETLVRNHLTVVLISSTLVQLHSVCVSQDANGSFCFSQLRLRDCPLAAELSSPSVSGQALLPEALFLLTRDSLSVWLLPNPSLESEPIKALASDFKAPASDTNSLRQSLFQPTLLHSIPLSRMNGQSFTLSNGASPLCGGKRLTLIGNRAAIAVWRVRSPHQCPQPLSWRETLGEDCACSLRSHLLLLDLCSPFTVLTTRHLRQSFRSLKATVASHGAPAYSELSSKFLPLRDLLDNLISHAIALRQTTQLRIEKFRFDDNLEAKHETLHGLLCQWTELRAEASLWFLQAVQHTPLPMALSVPSDLYVALLHALDWEKIAAPRLPQSTLERLTLLLSSVSSISSATQTQRNALMKILLLNVLACLSPTLAAWSSSAPSPCDRLSRDPSPHRLLPDFVVAISELDIFALFIAEIFSRRSQVRTTLPRQGQEEEAKAEREESDMKREFLSFVLLKGIPWNNCPCGTMAVIRALERWRDPSPASATLRALVLEHLHSFQSCGDPSPDPTHSTPTEFPIISALDSLWSQGSLWRDALMPSSPLPSSSLSSLSSSSCLWLNHTDSWPLVSIFVEGTLLRSFLLWQRAEKSESSQHLRSSLISLLLLLLTLNRDTHSEQLPSNFHRHCIQPLHCPPSLSSSSVSRDLQGFLFPSLFIADILFGPRWTSELLSEDTANKEQLPSVTLQAMYVRYVLSTPLKRLTRTAAATTSLVSEYLQLSDAEYRLFIRCALEELLSSDATIAPVPAFGPLVVPASLLCPLSLQIKEFKQLSRAILSLQQQETQKLNPMLPALFQFLLSHQRTLLLSDEGLKIAFGIPREIKSLLKTLCKDVSSLSVSPPDPFPAGDLWTSIDDPLPCAVSPECSLRRPPSPSPPH
jgi:hypothetical protein